MTIVGLLLNPNTHAPIMHATRLHPFLMGFAKFAVLASLGELLAVRVVDRRWSLPCGMIYRTFVWGFIGFCLVAIFAIFSSGVADALQLGLLPEGNSSSALIRAIWTSALLNLAFGPVMMCGHRILDTYIDLAGGRLAKLRTVKLERVIENIQWPDLIKFVCIRMLVFFWIPAHTITFLLPADYRLLYAASLSLFLGVILAAAKRARRGERQMGSLVELPAARSAEI